MDDSEPPVEPCNFYPTEATDMPHDSEVMCHLRRPQPESSCPDRKSSIGGGAATG